MSSWADHAIEELRAGREVVVCPRGHSMRPLIRSGEDVRLVPIGAGDWIEPGDVVLVNVRGRVYLHLVRAIEGDRFQIANNHGRVNGWVRRPAIYGRRTGA